jgi:hypothetical protein
MATLKMRTSAGQEVERLPDPPRPDDAKDEKPKVVSPRRGRPKAK